MSRNLSRRKFLGDVTTAGAGLYFGLSQVNDVFGNIDKTEDYINNFDWSDWEKYRETVKHPCLTIKATDLGYAHENMRRYGWAREYAARIERNIQHYFHLMTPAFLESMIEETTPGDPLWTPCPACRDKGKPVHPHGLWTWKIENPEQLLCDICGTVFPNSSYPENIILKTKWGKAQTITYCGGEPFVIFGYKQGRPSFSANIRSRKVQWIANYCRTLAEGFLLTGNLKYATVCRNILLRFADCYPTWLIHVGYGEYADMDPRIAARYITNLPEPEICPPPNEPDKSLWTGFWSAGRATGVGLESDFIRKMVVSYDLTCSVRDDSGNPVFTDSVRKKIEKDLLLESTILLVCDDKINNKSVSNRTAAALVGMCVGHPGLVRFGLDSFNKTVGGWYLSDGTSSETPFYGLMTLGGIWDMAQAARGYSDPSGYRDNKGNRIDSLDLYHNTPYHRVWDAFFRGLQGDLSYPPYADSFRRTSLDTSYVELMVANYPERLDYLALLKDKCGPDLSDHSGSLNSNNSIGVSETYDEPVLILPYDLTKPAGYSAFSFYYRKPGLEETTAPALKLPDWAPPELRIGHLRTGNDGRESLLLMSASHWGIHHDSDSLNLYYWKKGNEILSDLGYLWDHPLKPQTKRTLAHNTVLIDEKNQSDSERGGDLLMFKISDHVKVMEMSSKAYPDAKLYRRTSAIIDHGDGRNYVVDFFRVEGGGKQDYVFHGFDTECDILDLELQPSKNFKLYDFNNVRSADGDLVWRASWKSGPDMKCVAWSVGQKGENVYIADGWGQRDWKNSDIGATIPYIVRRTEGEGEKIFISLFEGYNGDEPFVRNVKLIDKTGVIEVETILGKDYIMSMHDSGEFGIGKGKERKFFSGHFTAGSLQKNKVKWIFEQGTSK
jgi:hypothetical protein